eukprot:Platyproteum_vivax@DN4418_c0_g1_i2.p1
MKSPTKSDKCKLCDFDNYSCCKVCHDYIVKAYQLKCGHSFCLECIYKWLCYKGIDATCPTCRLPARIYHLKATPALDRAIMEHIFTNKHMSLLQEYQVQNKSYSM